MSARGQRIEVITRGERRRRWSVEEKRAMVAESLEPGASPIAVARRHGIGSGLLYTWRRQLSGRSPVEFARAEVLAMPALPVSEAPADDRPKAGVCGPGSVNRAEGMIEIVLPNGVSVRVDMRVDSGALRRVLAVLAVR